MPGPTETEIKLGVPPQLLRLVEDARPLKDVGEGTVSHLTSTYYDTKDHLLGKHGISLRVRRDGERRVQTVKADGGSGGGIIVRREWQVELRDDELDFAAARKTVLGPLLSKKVRRALKPVFETRVRRKVFPVSDEDGSVEVAIDRGEIIADKRTSQISEVELELKVGDRPDKLFEIAGAVADVAPVHLQVRSKAERGYALANGLLAGPEKAGRVGLDRRAFSATAFQTIARSCLRQIIANEEAVERADDDGVHQMRVGLGRLRAMISVFKVMLDDRETRNRKSELRWLTNVLGPSRQLHVFEGRVMRVLSRAGFGQPAIDVLAEDMAARREAAATRVREALDSGRYRRLLLETAEWIEAGAWLTSLDPIRYAARMRPIGKFAAFALTSRTNKLIQDGGTLRTMDTAHRHKVRIAAKKVRYAAEAFASLFGDKGAQRRRRHFLAALADLQENLGNLNDVTADAELSESIADREGGRPARAPYRRLACVAGLAAGFEESQTAALVHASVRAHRRFARAPRFWC